MTAHSLPSARRPGFTLIELLVVIAIIAILAAILFPVFAQARRHAQLTYMASDLHVIDGALQLYYSDGGRYPTSLGDPKLQDLIRVVDNLGLPTVAGQSHTHSLNEPAIRDYYNQVRNAAEENKPASEVLDRVRASEADADAAPYYILSVKSRGGVDDYRLAGGLTLNPVRQENSDHYSNGQASDDGLVLRLDHRTAECDLTPDYCHTVWGGSEEEFGYWKDRGSANPRLPQYSLNQLLLTGRAAELVVPLLEDKPELIPRVRAYVQDPQNVTVALNKIS